MIKQLQMKLILVSMSALLAVLVLIITGMNVVNYCTVVQDADDLLGILSENRGVFPDKFGDVRPGSLPPDMSMEIPFETRYFSVEIANDSGEVTHVDTRRIASVDSKKAVELAKDVMEKKDNKGFEEDFRFAVYKENTYTRVIFLDCGRKLDAARDFLTASVMIALIGYGIVFLIVALTSVRIIRPISDSYEKQKMFITDAGHELKTPLTIINADVDVLTMELGENEWLTDIQKQTKRLTALTNDLVYLSKMEESGGTMQMIDFPVSDVVGEAAASFAAPAQMQNKEIRCNVQAMLSMRGNEKAIEQLVSILLDNAVKYAPVHTEILVSLEKQNKYLALSVSNELAFEIDKQSLQRLFERFYRPDQSRDSKTGGNGIGLSVAKAIVTAHGGKISAAEEKGKCLKITASFPT